MNTTASGLQYEDTVTGSGETAHAGQHVTVHYTGWLHDSNAPQGRGRKLDSSKDRNDSFAFPLVAAESSAVGTKASRACRSFARTLRGWARLAGVRVGARGRVATLVATSRRGRPA